MEIIKNLVPASKYNIKCPYTMNAQFIVVHNTANDASAANEIAYMVRNNNQVSFHYAVDNKQIIQGIPENRNAWHAGDSGNGIGNRNGIAIEICYSKSGGEKFDEAEKRAAQFVAYKLKEKGWGIDKVKKHQDFSGKYCPHRTLDRGWNRFLNMVRKELGQKPSNPQKPNKIAVDGYWGAATTRALQKYFGTSVDGVISGQYPNHITRNIPSASFTTRTGSDVIRAMQLKIGVNPDRYIGVETVRKLQRYLGTPIDGVISKPSMMVKEMQRRLNSGTF